MPSEPIKELWASILGIGTFAEPPDSLPLRLLGLEAVPASRDAVATAFRVRVKQFHPDVNPDRLTPLSLEDQPTSVQELMWARDILLRKVPEPVTDGALTPGDNVSRNGPKCRACKGERRDWEGRPYQILGPAYGTRKRWVGYCLPCAEDAERERQRQERLEARTDLICVECRTKFTPPRSDATYCSPACRQRAHRKRRKKVG